MRVDMTQSVGFMRASSDDGRRALQSALQPVPPVPDTMRQRRITPTPRPCPTEARTQPDRLQLMSSSTRAFLLGPLLKGVSRSFYLTLRILPAGMRDPIGLAYLLARAADTIADTSLIPPEQRLALLLALRDQVNGAADDGALIRRMA